ncbi:hypothetical protein [Anaeromassilibacillus senegalensis]|uniref:DUF4760 domain-containing protein n=1 Tax=Anaeromassilibacillus senegalensis TaxID=1673717 RepID=A0ABS9CRP9_9FIRM|nr:hypothetical protein [Anaeromassilibacillus senegalensis]MCF2653318.1 hypothetical protein [Anaeromassilibacillus senegalensis]
MDKTEIIFKIIEISIAFIGLVLVIFGWIVPHRNSIKTEKTRIQNDKELERIRWKKELIDKQISNLYGPMYALIIEGEVSFSRILYQLGRRCVIPRDKSFSDLPEDEQKIWKHYVDTYKIENQMKMVEIMRDNLHLIYNSEIPTCYKEFLDYSLGWEMLDNQKRNGVPNYYEYHYVFNYPTEFNHYIGTTLQTLLEEQGKLLKQSEQA